MKREQEREPVSSLPGAEQIRRAASVIHHVRSEAKTMKIRKR